MKDGGSIILNSSIAGVKGFPGHHSLQRQQSSCPFFCQNLDCRAQRKDQSQCHQSRTIDTAIFDGTPQELKDGFVSIIQMGRMGQPREIASAALFLASDDSSFVSGIELFVDGCTAQV